QPEPHGLRVEAVGGLEITGGDGDVVESHPFRIARPGIRSPSMGARPSWRAVAIAAAALGSAGVAAALAGGGPAPEPVDTRPPAEQFLDAWATSRAATFRLEADFVRTSNSTGAELRDHFVVAQRPPDRLTVDGDGATGLVDGRRIACSYAADGDLRCQEAEAQRT